MLFLGLGATLGLGEVDLAGTVFDTRYLGDLNCSAFVIINTLNRK